MRERFAAWVFLGVILLLFGSAIFTLIRDRQKIIPPEPNARALIEGHVTAAAGKAFEKEFALQDAAVGSWGALRYLLFHIGNEGVLIGKDGWLYTTEEFKSSVNGDSEKEIASKFRTILQVDAYLREHGVQLVIALIPAKARIYPENMGNLVFPARKQSIYHYALETLRQGGVYAPDLERALRQHKADGLLFMRTDTHWTPLGANVTAEFLAETIRHDCTLNLPAASFSTQLQPVEAYPGDLGKFVPLGPLADKIGPGSEPLVRSETVAAGEKSEGLFASEQIPVVLIGTSYSAFRQWNFEGALKTALKADVLNLADEGQGPMVPMQKFLSGEQLDSLQPKLVIWEIPERFLATHYDTSFDMLKNIVPGNSQSLAKCGSR